MAYTDIDKPSDYFNTVLRSGLYGGSDTAFTVGFQPDWIWDKRRSDTSVHALFDSVRGFGASGKVLYSNSTDAEGTNALIDSVSSTGFTIKASSDNTGTLVDWCWKAGTAFTNDASATGIGSIDSAGSVNTDAGFSITSYTGTGSNATFSHGLGSVPKMAIFKDRTSTGYWMTYHEAVGNGANLVLNTSDASSASSVWWNSTSPTSSVFSIGTSTNINVSGRDYIGYLFAEKKGYSKFGSYTGNGDADGTFVYTGFKPAWIMIKATSGTENWRMYDNKRNGFNVDNEQLFPNLNNAEASDADLDILSNGFKCRRNSGGFNNSGTTYIYMAFAENPFVTSGGVPATAR